MSSSESQEWTVEEWDQPNYSPPRQMLGIQFQDPPEDAEDVFGMGQEIHVTPAASATWKINAALTPAQRQQVNDIVDDNRSAFLLDASDMGVTHVTTFSIDTGNSPPIKQKAYRVSPAEESLMYKEVSKLREADLIEPCNSPWASPAILVSKKGDPIHKGKAAAEKQSAERRLRLCIDLRALNKVTRKDAYPVPRIDVILDGIGSGRYFCKLDLKSAYYQVAMADEDSMDRTAFVTPFGTFRWKVMPLGLANAPSAFARLGDTIFAGLIGKCMFIYIDDIIVWGSTFEEMVIISVGFSASWQQLTSRLPQISVSLLWKPWPSWVMSSALPASDLTQKNWLPWSLTPAPVPNAKYAPSWDSPASTGDTSRTMPP
jgi:hypothetical protein